MTFFGEYYFTNFGEYIFENLNKSLKLSQILVTKFLKISLIQQNFHQFWWKNMCKIINKYCHRFRWNFHHLITHYFLWFTKKITRIGENSAKNSSENQDGLLPPAIALLAFHRIQPGFNNISLSNQRSQYYFYTFYPIFHKSLWPFQLIHVCRHVPSLKM